MSGAIRLNGATSGYVELVAPDVAGDVQVMLPQGFLPSGLVPIRTQTFSGVASASLDDVFSSDYDNYRIVVTGSGTTLGYLQMRYRLAGVDASAATYATQSVSANDTSPGSSRQLAQTAQRVGYTAPGTYSFEMTVLSPAQVAATTTLLSGVYQTSGTTPTLQNYTNWHSTATAYDGFTIYPDAGTISGTVTVYGYAKAIVTPIQPPTTGDPAMGALVLSRSFTAQSAVSVDDCFTSDYDTYRVAVRLSASTAGSNGLMRMRAAGVDASGASDYGFGSFYHAPSGNVLNLVSANNASSFNYMWYSGNVTAWQPVIDFEVDSPALAKYTALKGSFQYRQTDPLQVYAGFHGAHMLAQAYDGFTIYPSAGTISGTLTIHGYAKA